MKHAIIISLLALFLVGTASAAMFNQSSELNKPVNPGNITASSSQGSGLSEYAFDNDISTEWISTNTAPPHTIQIDLGQEYDLNRVWMQTRKVGDTVVCLGNFSIEHSLNGADWTDWSGSINQTGTPVNECFRADPSALPNINYYNFTNFSVTARYVRLRVQQERSDGANNEAKLQEFGITANGSTLNLTAINGATQEIVNEFSVYLGPDLLGSTTNGHIYFPIFATGNYTMTATAADHSNVDDTIEVLAPETNHTFSFFDLESVQIYIRDEETNALINRSTITFTSETTEFSNITNGTFYATNLTLGVYTVTGSADGYNSRAYEITVSNASYQQLNIFLINSTDGDTTTFIVSDQDTGDLLPNVSVSMSKIINGNWEVVENRITDISGSTQLSYIPDSQYRFLLTKAEYENNLFYLNPILYDTYNIRMSKSTQIPYEPDYEGIAFDISPEQYRNHQNNLFNFIIASPTGSLTQYGANITYPHGEAILTGVNSQGGTLTTSLYVNSTSILDTVRVDYYYVSVLGGRRNFTAYYDILRTNATGYNQTFIANRDKTYGMGIFERVLIATLIVIFVIGIATMAGQSIPGLAIGLFVFGYMAFIGFVPILAIAPSIFIGFLYLLWKSGGI